MKNLSKKVSILLVMFLMAFVSVTHAAWNTWLDTSIQKYRQDGVDGTSGSQGLTIKAAKNEFESFQVLIYADGETLTNVDVTVSDFRNEDNVVDNIYIYKQHYLRTVNRSRAEYELGLWPDALLPKVDRYYGETRNAFPMYVSNGNVQGVWVDVGTTVQTVAGTYRATVTITADGKASVQLPVTLVVRDFALPSKKTFAGTAGLQDGYLSYAHMGTAYHMSTMTSLFPLYAKAALYHGISTWPYGSGIYNGTYSWNDSTATMSGFNATNWNSYYSNVRNGTAIASGPYVGAVAKASFLPGIGGAHNMGVSSVIERDTRISDRNKETAARQYYQSFYNNLGEHGWNPDEYLFIPVFDEPQTGVSVTWYREADNTANEVEVALDQANDARSIDTSVYGDGSPFSNIFVNGHNSEAMANFPGFFDPWIGHFAPDNWEKTNTNSSYIYPASGYPDSKHAWAYLSCMSNGCAGSGNNWYSGQVDLSVDAPGVYNRFWSYIFYKHSRNGFLFWSLNTDMVNGGGDPYNSTWYYGSNGDGHLFYPGVAGEFGGSPGGSHTPHIGGTHDIPIESIRLKHIRDGIEDMDYFAMAEAVTNRATVESIVDRVFTTSNIDLAYWSMVFEEEVHATILDQVASLISKSIMPPYQHPPVIQ